MLRSNLCHIYGVCASLNWLIKASLLMKIIRLLLQNSGSTFIIAAIASLISGMGSAGMIAVINYAIAGASD